MAGRYNLESRNAWNPDGRLCAVEHKDNARRGAARSHEGVRGRTVALPRKAEAAQKTLAAAHSLGKLTGKGKIMQELEVLDLGDVMLETRCASFGGLTYDNLYGPFHWSC